MAKYLEDQGRGDEEINMVTIVVPSGASAQVGRTEGMDNKLKSTQLEDLPDRQSGEFTQAKGPGSYGVLLKGELPGYRRCYL